MAYLSIIALELELEEGPYSSDFPREDWILPQGLNFGVSLVWACFNFFSDKRYRSLGTRLMLHRWWTRFLHWTSPPPYQSGDIRKAFKEDLCLLNSLILVFATKAFAAAVHDVYPCWVQSTKNGDTPLLFLESTDIYFISPWQYYTRYPCAVSFTLKRTAALWQ